METVFFKPPWFGGVEGVEKNAKGQIGVSFFWEGGLLEGNDDQWNASVIVWCYLLWHVFFWGEVLSGVCLNSKFSTKCRQFEHQEMHRKKVTENPRSSLEDQIPKKIRVPRLGGMGPDGMMGS